MKIMLRLIPGLLFCVIIGVMLFSTYQKSTQPSGAGMTGQPAPGLRINKVEGFSPPPSSEVLFRQQYVLVNFFASWCTPCLAEHPYLQQLAGEYDLTIAGIAWRDSPSNIKEMLQEHGNPYRYVGIDLMDGTAFAYGVKGLPESFLISPEGDILATHRGPLVPDVIKEKILPHLPTARPASP